MPQPKPWNPEEITMYEDRKLWIDHAQAFLRADPDPAHFGILQA